MKDTWSEWRLVIHEGGNTVNYDFAICDHCKAITHREDAYMHQQWHEGLADSLADLWCRK